MPFLLPALGAIFSVGGLFGTTGAIAAGIGGTLGATIGGALMGATIGAAIGGFSSLVMGGDIGKGMLFGAIGGAVTGGLNGFLSTSTLLSGGTDLATGLTSEVGKSGGMIFDSISGEVVGNTAVAETAKTGLSGFMSGASDEVMGAAVEGGIGLIGQTMAGMGAEEKWKAEMDAQIAEAEKQRQFEMEKLKMTLDANAKGGGGGSAPDRDWAAELAENRRQFDAEISQRKHEFEKTMGIRKDELYAPMENEKARIARAGSALSSVKMGRGRYKQDKTIKKQVQEANTYPEPVTVEEEVQANG